MPGYHDSTSCDELKITIESAIEIDWVTYFEGTRGFPSHCCRLHRRDPSQGSSRLRAWEPDRRTAETCSSPRTGRSILPCKISTPAIVPTLLGLYTIKKQKSYEVNFINTKKSIHFSPPANEVWGKVMFYRSGTVNSNTVNSKFHLIRSFFEYLARFLSFHV